MSLNQPLQTVAILSLGLGNLIQAGEQFSPAEASFADHALSEPSDSSFNLCDAFVNMGKLYKDTDNPFIQEFKIHGRINYQAASFDGRDVNGLHFNSNFEEIRRLRIGTKIKFLEYFNLKFTANMGLDNRPKGGDLDWGYENLDEAFIGFDIKKAFGLDGLDKLHILYGVPKFDLGGESYESSKKIVTAERSGISNKVYVDGIRPTGFKLSGAKGDWDFLLGLYSTEENPEFDAKWDQGFAYQGTLGYQMNDEHKLVADFLYNDSGIGQENQFTYEWALSLRSEYVAERWGVMTEAFIGDNGDEGNGVTNADRQGHFWAAVITPYYYLIPDRLQLGFQYQYAASSEEEGIRTSSRYLRRDHDNRQVDVGGGRGDEHHSVYLGLNYLLCDHNAKIMTGIQYDDLNAKEGNVKGTTLWVAYRTFF